MQTINPLVSIIIPVYNGSNYLHEAINSALSQSYSPIEVIIINDGSDDNEATKKLALSFRDRISYIEKENGGVASALNTGIDSMRGDFFSWLSHDDLYYPYKIEKQLAFYQSLASKKNIIFSHEDVIDAHGLIIEKGSIYNFNPKFLNYELLYNHFIGGCSLLIPRQAFKDVGIFSTSLQTVQDYEMWFRMIKSGYAFEYLPITTGMSRRHEAQDSRLKWKLAKKEQDRLYREIQQNLPPPLWIENCADIPSAFYQLAIEFNKRDLKGVRNYDLLQGDRAVSSLPIEERVKYLWIKLAVLAKITKDRLRSTLLRVNFINSINRLRKRVLKK